MPCPGALRFRKTFRATTSETTRKTALARPRLEASPSALPHRPATLRSRIRTVAPALALLPALLSLTPPAQASERLTLRNGNELTCDHQEPQGTHTRIFLTPGAANYLELPTTDIVSIEILPALPPAAATLQAPSAQTMPTEVLTPQQLRTLLTRPGHTHNLDLDLLASVVHAESASHVHARSRTGAQGLMQLMPGTATQLGVQDAYAPDQNLAGGTAYLDALLTRYHDNLALALAAYNAGPAAVDRWHGIPPYRETRLYVAHIIHEFNQRWAARQNAAASLATVTAQTSR